MVDVSSALCPLHITRSSTRPRWRQRSVSVFALIAGPGDCELGLNCPDAPFGKFPTIEYGPSTTTPTVRLSYSTGSKRYEPPSAPRTSAGDLPPRATDSTCVASEASSTPPASCVPLVE